ncbi:hypothetical protein N9L24_03020 [Candidatus Marinamargulisbacteria bacterium]|nr:hypothetical protein [Candidatus Marinamargulisbacteria bacterium]
MSISKNHVKKLNDLTTNSAQINFPENSEMDAVTYTTILEAQINYELCYDQLGLKFTIGKKDFLRPLLVQHHKIKNELSKESAEAIVDIEVLCKKLKSYKLLIDSNPKFFDYCIENNVLSRCIEHSKAIVDLIGECSNNCVSYSKTVCEGIISSYAIIWLSFSSVRDLKNVTQGKLRACKETDKLMNEINSNFEDFYQALSTVKGDSDKVISESLKTHFYSRLDVLVIHFIRNFIDCKSGKKHQGIPNKSLSNAILLLQMVPRDYQFSCDHRFRDVDSILGQIELKLSKNQQGAQSSNCLCEEERIKIQEELIWEQDQEEKEQRQEQERQRQAQKDLSRNNINPKPDEDFFDSVDSDEDFFDPDEDSFYTDYDEARKQILTCMTENSLDTIEQAETILLTLLARLNSNNYEESTDMCHLKKLLVNYALADLYFLKGAFDFSSHVSQIQTDSTKKSIKYSEDAIGHLKKISEDFKRNNFNVIDQVFNGLRIQMDAANTRIKAAELSTERWLDRLHQSRLAAMARYARLGYSWVRNTDSISPKAQERRDAIETLKQLNELKAKMGLVQRKVIICLNLSKRLIPASNDSGF